MKKFRVLIIVFISLLMVPFSVNAESIQDYRDKIKAIEKEREESENKSAEVQAEIDDAKARINEISREIASAQRERENTLDEIKQLDKDIAAKEDEIKDLVAFYQVSDNENFYLKFIFGAESFEDFIYRFSVAEQLTDANDKLVAEMNDLIKENEKKVKELEDQQVRLNNLSDQVAALVKKLGAEKQEYTEEALDADEEIEALKEQIAYFKKKGCNETQDVSTCSVGIVPSSSGFQLPLSHGIITTYYGYQLRDDIGETIPRLHAGMDFGAGTGTPIMATNSGEVIRASWFDGYGNAVMIVHNVKGKLYTSLYAHMDSIGVSQGQTVTRGQVIGTVGNTGYSFGAHLHFQMMYGSGYSNENSFNPQNLMSIPYSW